MKPRHAPGIFITSKLFFLSMLMGLSVCANLAHAALGFNAHPNAFVATPKPGTIAIKKNQKGELRFWIDANGARHPPEVADLLHYIKYDAAGRAIEAGLWRKNWAELSDAALDDPNFPRLSPELDDASLSDPREGRPVWRTRTIFATLAENGAPEAAGLIALQTNLDRENPYSQTYQTERLAYDEAGRISATEEQATSGVVLRTEFHYHANGALARIHYPAAKQTAWTVDSRLAATDGARKKSVDDALIVTYTYDDLGRLAGIGRIMNDRHSLDDDTTLHDPHFYARYRYTEDGSVAEEILNAGIDSPAPISTSIWMNREHPTNAQIDELGKAIHDIDGYRVTYQIERHPDEAKQVLYQQTLQLARQTLANGRLTAPKIIREEQRWEDPANHQDGRTLHYTYNEQSALEQTRVQPLPSASTSGNFADDSATRFGLPETLQRNPVSEAAAEAAPDAAQWDANGNVIAFQKTNALLCLTIDRFLDQVIKIETYTSTTLACPRTESAKASSVFSIDYAGMHQRRSRDQWLANDGSKLTQSYHYSAQETLLSMRHQRTSHSDHQQSGRRHFIYGLSGLIAVNLVQEAPDPNTASTPPTPEKAAQGDYFVLKNHLGSSVMVVRQDGHVAQRYDYASGGSVTDHHGQAIQAEQIVPVLFQRQHYDWQTGLHDFRARLYDSQRQRFLAPDPAFSHDASPYTAFSDDPINQIDPDGRAALRWILASALLASALYTAHVVDPHVPTGQRNTSVAVALGESAIQRHCDGSEELIFNNASNHSVITFPNCSDTRRPNSVAYVTTAAIGTAGFFMLPPVTASIAKLFAPTVIAALGPVGPAPISLFSGYLFARCLTYAAQGLYESYNTEIVMAMCLNGIITMFGDNAYKEATWKGISPTSAAAQNRANEDLNFGRMVSGLVPLVVHSTPRTALIAGAILTQNFLRSVGGMVGNNWIWAVDAHTLSSDEFDKKHHSNMAWESARIVATTYTGMFVNTMSREAMILCFQGERIMTTPYVGTLPGDLFRLLARAPIFAAFHARDINTGFRYGFGWKEGVFDLIQSAALHKWFEQDRTLQRHFDHCYQ